MTTQARIGYGTLFQSGDGASPEQFTTFAEVTNIDPPETKVDSVDATHHQSPNAAREFIPGLIDGGEVSLEFNFVPGSATTLALMADITARTLKTRRVVFPDNSYFQFSAFCTSFKPGAPLDDKMTGTGTWKVSGLPTLVQA